MIDINTMLKTAKDCGMKFVPAQFTGVLEAEISEFDLDAYTRVVTKMVADAEREACAAICDLQHDRARTSTGAVRADACAQAIRARGTGGEG